MARKKLPLERIAFATYKTILLQGYTQEAIAKATPDDAIVVDIGPRLEQCETSSTTVSDDVSDKREVFNDSGVLTNCGLQVETSSLHAWLLSVQ